MPTAETGDVAEGAQLIWARVPAETRAEMEEWYFSEHLPERLDVPGFRTGWRWLALDAPDRMLTLYETDGLEVLFGPAYLARVGDPSPWTRRVMGEGLQTGLVRTVCRLAAREGAIRGAFTVSARFDGVCRPRRMTAPPACCAGAGGRRKARPSPRPEERLRGGDTRIGGALLADPATESEARVTAADWRARFSEAVVGTWRFLCLLDRRDLPA